MTMWDLVIIGVNVIIPIALFLGWLWAELRWRASVRIVLGLACMAFLGFQVWINAEVAKQHLVLHTYGLRLIERRLDEDTATEVRNALRLYGETYEDTQNAEAAVIRMISALRE